MEEVEIKTDLKEGTVPATEHNLPCCPYCGQKPVKLNLMFTSFPQGQIASLVYCGNPDCLKVLPVQIVGMNPAAEKSRILTPFGGKK